MGGLNFNGLWDGEVVDVKDPFQVGRVRVMIRDIHDENTPVESLPWAMPCFPAAFSSASVDDDDPNGGFFQIPPNGSTVYVMFHKGDPNFPIWMGGFFAPRLDGQPVIGGREGYESHIHRKALYNTEGIPACPTWKSVGGHIIEMDDDAGEVRITSTSGNKITLGDSGSTEHGEGIKLEDSNGNYIHLDSTNRILKIYWAHDVQEYYGGNVHRTIKGNVVEDVDGNVVRTVGGNESTTIEGQWEIDYMRANMGVKPTTIDVPIAPRAGRATSGFARRLDSIITFFRNTIIR